MPSSDWQRLKWPLKLRFKFQVYSFTIQVGIKHNMDKQYNILYLKINGKGKKHKTEDAAGVDFLFLSYFFLKFKVLAFFIFFL